MCITIYIFNFQKNPPKNKAKQNKTKKPSKYKHTNKQTNKTKKQDDKKHNKLEKKRKYLWKILSGYDDIVGEFALCTFNLIDQVVNLSWLFMRI